MLAVEIQSHLDGHLGARVDEVVLPAITVVNPYSVFVGLRRAGGRHYLPPVLSFPDWRPFLGEAALHLHGLVHFLASAPNFLWKKH